MSFIEITQLENYDLSLYKSKKLKYNVECGRIILWKNAEIKLLTEYVGKNGIKFYPKLSHDILFNQCVGCDEIINNYGIFAIETILFIPNKNDPLAKNLNRFRTKIPRICCIECDKDYQEEHHINKIDINIDYNNIIKYNSLLKEWKLFINNHSNKENFNDLNNKFTEELKQKDKNNFTEEFIQNDNNNEQIENNEKNQSLINQSMQQNQNQIQNQTQTQTQSITERDPFEDGFLICTQLVKTGGADQGGLQVGDVFVEFGHYSKQKFPGLKSIANLVRRSANKEISVVVWRKSETSTKDTNGQTATLFQKLALKLIPLQSHDADGGGVLGAVINIYPLPEMKS